MLVKARVTFVMPGASGSYSKGSCLGSRMMLRPYRIVDVAPSISTINTNQPYLRQNQKVVILPGTCIVQESNHSVLESDPRTVALLYLGLRDSTVPLTAPVNTAAEAE